MLRKSHMGGVARSLALTLVLVVIATMSAFADVEITKTWNDDLSGASAKGRSVPTVTITGETSYEKLLNLMYPVGSCYFSLDASFDPNTSWGGTWEKLADGVFLQSTQTETQVGTNVAAGLPNITGSCSASGWYGEPGAAPGMSGSGAFVRNSSRISLKDITNGNGWVGGGYGLNFDASRSSSIYGKSTTVQPPAIKAFIWKRVS